IQQAELAQAMATGLVSALMPSGTAGWDTTVYEYMTRSYDTQAWLPKNAILVNKKAFDALDQKCKDALLKAAEAAEKRGWELSREKTQWYLDNLAKNGMDIVKPSDELMSGLSKVGETMLNEWLEKAGADGKQVIDAYRAQ